jgi:hypothetical protein
LNEAGFRLAGYDRVGLAFGRLIVIGLVWLSTILRQFGQNGSWLAGHDRERLAISWLEMIELCCLQTIELIWLLAGWKISS